MRKKYFAGLDIGGSTIKSVLVDEQANQIGRVFEVESRVTEGFRATFEQLELSLKNLADDQNIKKSDIKGLGIDVPAPNCDGVIWGKANLAQDWVGKNIRDEFSQISGLPVFMTNDVNAAALGEYVVRGMNTGSLLFVAPGTGLGGGFVLPGGKLYEGVNGLAMEAGHLSVPFYDEQGQLPLCSCGLRGCLEAWVSLVALRRNLKSELTKEKWQNHPLNQEKTSIEKKAFKLRDYAEKDDPLALELFQKQGYILGYAIADMVRLFDPGLVVIGGGLAESPFKTKYLEFVMEGFTKRAWPMYIKNPLNGAQQTTHIEWAHGGDYAGALGMAFMAHELFI
jgi:glucokinase